MNILDQRHKITARAVWSKWYETLDMADRDGAFDAGCKWLSFPGRPEPSQLLEHWPFQAAKEGQEAYGRSRD